jgi:hypothetical protein
MAQPTVRNSDHTRQIFFNETTRTLHRRMKVGSFVIQAENRASAEVLNATEIRYRRSLKCSCLNDGSDHVVELYDIIVPGCTNTQWPVKPQAPEEACLGPIPKWLRQQRRADKRAWRALGQVFRCTPRFEREFFDPLPEVPVAELSAGQS